MSESNEPKSSGPRSVTSPGRTQAPSSERARRRVLLLAFALVASLGLPHVLSVPRSSLTGELEWGWLAATAGGCLFVLGAALLAVRHAIQPELDALEQARAEVDARCASALGGAQPTNAYLRDVSHEMRASMHAVLGLAQLLARSPLDPNQHRQVRTIDGAARALLRIMNDLLALSGPEPHRFEVVPMGCSLHELLRVSADLLEPAATDKGLALELRIAVELPDRVLTDAGRVQQIVLGVCRYAIEISEHGRLRIDARAKNIGDQRFDLSLRVECPRPSDERPGRRPGALVASGANLPAANGSLDAKAPADGSTNERPANGSPRADDAAPASHAPPPSAAGDEQVPASAAGLSLSQRLVAMLGGSIQRSEARGTLELSIPMARIDLVGGDSAAPPRASPVPLSIRLPPTVSPILVVEPNQQAQAEVAEVLEDLGFDIELVGGAAPALERAGQKKYALIVLALDAPELDAAALAEQLRLRLGAERPAILGMSPEPLGAARERAGTAQFEALVSKPLERAALSVVLAQWLSDEAHPASSGMRLSKIGALERATQRGLETRISSAPASTLPDLEPRLHSERSRELFVLEAPGQLVALARAAARGRRDEVVMLAQRLKERCSNCGAMKMAALCRRLEGARELSIEQLGTDVKALGKALEAVMAELGEPVAVSESAPASAAESAPASATSDRTPTA